MSKLRILALSMRLRGGDGSLFLHSLTSAASGSVGIESPLMRRLEKIKQAVGQQWNQWGAAPERSLRRRIHAFGTNLRDRQDHREFFLRGIPTTGDPSVTSITIVTDPHTQPELAATTLRDVASAKWKHHSTFYYLSILCLPLSATATILPGPNVFLLYNAVRVYEHKKARDGAKFLIDCLDNSGEPVVQVDERLTDLFSDVASVDDGAEKGDIITEDAIRRMKDEFGYDAEVVDHLRRARIQLIKQTEASIKSK